MEHTIQYVCHTLGLTVHTVRHYCDMGLVPSLRTDSHGNRLFDQESLNWLQAAVFLRGSGMSIPAIREYFQLCQEGISTLKQRQEILIDLKAQAERELAALQRRIACLDQRIDLCQQALDSGGEDDSNPLNW